MFLIVDYNRTHMFPFFVHLQSDKEVKAFFYIDAVMFFARCGKAIEVSSISFLWAV